MRMNEKGQMVAPAACKMTANDFKNNGGTSIYWLGGGGAGDFVGTGTGIQN